MSRAPRSGAPIGQRPTAAEAGTTDNQVPSTIAKGPLSSDDASTKKQRCRQRSKGEIPIPRANKSSRDRSSRDRSWVPGNQKVVFHLCKPRKSPQSERPSLISFEVQIRACKEEGGSNLDVAIWVQDDAHFPLEHQSQGTTPPQLSMQWVPADFVRDDKEEVRLPNRPKSRGEVWDQAQRAAMANPSDIRKWDALFGMLEHQAERAEGAAETSASLKKAVADSYSVFLKRFPYAAAYWKQFLIVQYKLYGPHKSIECLEKAVQAHPQSLILWGDYLAGLVAMELESWKAGKETHEAGSKYTVESIREQFLHAETLIGRNFNSELFWDRFIAFESLVARRLGDNAASKLLLALYLRLLRVPLYQYAQYYAQFGELSKSFGASEVVPAASMPEYLSRFGKTDVAELSAIESHQLVDLYAYDVFLQTQQAVTAKWPFESSLSMQDFSVGNATAAASQVGVWQEYVAHEIQAFDAVAKTVAMPVMEVFKGDWHRTETSLTEASARAGTRHFLAVQSVFERALVPNCTNEDLWMKYIEFVCTSTKNGEAVIRGLYERAIFTFLPSGCRHMRKSYGDWLLKTDGFDAATEFWLRVVQLYSGSHQVYAKEAYVWSVREIVLMWSVHANVQQVLESLCELHFGMERSKKRTGQKEADQRGRKAILLDNENGHDNKETDRTDQTDQTDKETKKETDKTDKTEKETDKTDKTEKETEKTDKTDKTEKKIDGQKEKKAQIPAEHVNQLARCLNDDGIAVVAVQHLRNVQDRVHTTRAFYNRFHTQPAFSRSVQFWRFFMDFEIAQTNLLNIKTIMSRIETCTELPKLAIDCFLDMQYEATCANLPQAFASPEKDALLEILVLLHAKKSDDLVVNASARARLAALSTVEPESRSVDRATSLMNLRSKHLAHPGIFVHRTPEVTNCLLDKEWISLLEDDLKVPSLPVFRNLDKANAPVTYPDE